MTILTSKYGLICCFLLGITSLLSAQNKETIAQRIEAIEQVLQTESYKKAHQEAEEIDSLLRKKGDTLSVHFADNQVLLGRSILEGNTSNRVFLEDAIRLYQKQEQVPIEKLVKAKIALYKTYKKSQAEAEILLNNVFELAKANLPNTHPLCADLYLHKSNLLYFKKDNLKSAKDYAERAKLHYERYGAAEIVTPSSIFIRLSQIEQQKGDWTKGEAYMESALAAINEKVATCHINRFYVEFSHAAFLLKSKKLEAAKRVYLKLTNCLEETQANAAGTYANLATVYKNLGETHRALLTYEKSLAALEQEEAPNVETLGGTYLNAGLLRQAMGDHAMGELYIKKARQLFKENFGKTHRYTRIAEHNLGVFYLNSQNYEQARPILQDLRKYYKSNEANNPKLAIALGNLAEIERKSKNFGIAKEYLQEGLVLKQKIYSEGDINLLPSYLQLSKLSLDQNRAVSALNHLNKAEQIVNATDEIERRMLSVFYQDKAEVYVQFHDFKSAFAALDLAQATVTQDDLSNLESVYSLNQLLYCLNKKAKLYQLQFEEDASLANLGAAKATYDTLFRVLDYVKQSAYTSENQTLAQQFYYDDFENALNTCYKLYQETQEERYQEQAFEWMEKSKASVLLAQVHSNQQNASHYVPDSLLRLEQQLLSEITQLREELYEAKEEKSQEESEQVLFERSSELEALKTRFKQSYPTYYQLKFNTATTNITQLQSQFLDDKTAILEFFLGDSTTWLTTITKDKFELQALPLASTSIKQQIRALQTSLSQTDNPTAFQAVAQLLYQNLLASSLEDLPVRIENLLIIPDGILNYVPFEALLSAPPKVDVPLPYLIRTHNVSYAYSASILLQQQVTSKYKEAEHLFAGFAPSYDFFVEKDTLDNTLLAQLMRAGNHNLPGAKAEVQAIQQLLKGVAYTDLDATETQFKAQSKLARILHLSMHTLIEDQQPLFSKLLFASEPDGKEDGELTAGELYNMQLQADLAVLSACETGYGKLQKGEGIMSLSRAFAAAGVPALVNSLWKVPDNATSDIMVAFYEALKAGKTKDAALRSAKLEYLDNTLIEQQQHPYYWAGFIASGDMSAMDLGGGIWANYWHFIVLGTLLFMLFFFGRKG